MMLEFMYRVLVVICTVLLLLIISLVAGCTGTIVFMLAR
jgi:hypothetical protein